MLFALFLLLASFAAVAVQAAGSLSSQCGCGYQDPDTKEHYTEAIIVYFNETNTVDPEVFSTQTWAHKKQHGWQSIYKVGANVSNAAITNYTAYGKDQKDLQLLLEPSTQDHVVYGGILETPRRDIQYGSFQAAMKSATQWTGGTALTFALQYNASQSLEIDFMNMKDPELARVSNLVNGEWPSADIGSPTVYNYTQINDTGVDAWKEFVNVRFDWNKTNVDFWVADNKTRSITKKDRSLPLAAQSMRFQTWSNGDKTYMQGPPMKHASQSHVLWVRTFFNSSTMTTTERKTYDNRCSAAEFCLTNDMSLRGATEYSKDATKAWVPPPKHEKIRKNAGFVAGACSTFGILALINVILRKAPWSALKLGSSRKSSSSDSLRKFVQRSFSKKKPKGQHERNTSNKSSENGASWNTSSTGIRTPLPAYGARTPISGSATPAPAYETPPAVPHNGIYRSVSLASLRQKNSPPQVSYTPTSDNISMMPRKESDERENPALGRITESRNEKTMSALLRKDPDPEDEIMPASEPVKEVDESIPIEKQRIEPLTEKGHEAVITSEELGGAMTKPAAKTEAAAPAKPAPTKRVDYLAGLVGVACMGVTLHHFCQTFWPWVTEGYGQTAHYPKVEKYAQIFIGSYALTQLWIGPFFLTATRFLTTNYLKNGNLEDIAKKELRRAPRLFVPIIIISALEYFLISMGLTAALQWLPSVTWSTWPYVMPQANFGAYISNLIELAYAMPNYIPEIVPHYCIGVLWTVPVQLQFTYVVLAACVLIRDMRNPYKRFGFYTVVILAGWYAKSWSACHWCGLVLSDLEATYKWKVYLNAKKHRLYAVMTFAFVCAFGAPLIAVFNQHWSFSTLENSLHPDIPTGKAIMQIESVYPGYNEPTLAVLAFSIGLQILVELSTIVQWLLSTRVVLWLHPHIMTVYLTHGFVMWTWGAWVAVAMNQAGVPYWANLLITLITTYTMIFLLASVLSPLIDFPTQAFMRNLDRWMKYEPVKKRATTQPFTKRMVEGRHKSAEKDVKEA